jgi:hypothetical protein
MVTMAIVASGDRKKSSSIGAMMRDDVIRHFEANR